MLPQYSETYTFQVEADDWARLWIGGQQILVIGEVSISSVVRHLCFAGHRA